MGAFLAVVQFCGLYLIPDPRKEQKITEIRNSSAAQVCQAEALHEGLGVLVSSGAIIVLVVGVRADLDAAVWQLCSRVHIPEPIRSHEHIHIINQPGCPSGKVDLPETFGPDGPRPTTGRAGGPPIHVAMGGHGFWEVYLPGEREYADKYGGDCRGC